MSNNYTALSAEERFLHTLKIVSKEGKHMLYSWQRLYKQLIDKEWVQSLDSCPERAEQMEAFVSRYGRMQDTIADKLLPRWLLALAETPASQIETLNRAERLGVIESTEEWLSARKLRNRLVCEYMTDDEQFPQDLWQAKQYTGILVNTYNAVHRYAEKRMEFDTTQLPAKLEFIL